MSNIYSAVIPAADFLRLAGVLSATSTPATYCVRVEPTPNGAIALATEGHVLAAMRYQDGEAYCAAPVSIRPSKELLKAARATSKEQRYVAVRADDQSVCVLLTPRFDGHARWQSAGLGQVMASFPAAKAIERERYPNWRSVVPSGTPSGAREANVRPVSLDPALLGKLEAWGETSWDWDGANAVRVACQDDSRFAALIMPRWSALSAQQVVDRAADVLGVPQAGA